MVPFMLTTKLNDPRVNYHNHLQLQNWRGNVDLQIIVDTQAAARYMAKYAAKGEPRSQAASDIFSSCISTLLNESNTRSFLHRAMKNTESGELVLSSLLQTSL
jgi:hypothetical protein